MGEQIFDLSAFRRLEETLSAKNEWQRKERICENSASIKKELPPCYCLQKVVFDDETRIAKITYICNKQYRTIDRYITRNYQRYPVYSHWKIKTSYIPKTIKLTNHALENLQKHEDFLIRDFASEIILSINRPELVPSWLAQQIISNERKLKTDEQHEKQRQLHKDFDTQKNRSAHEVSSLTDVIKSKEIYKTKLELKIDKLNNKINKIKGRKNNIFLSLLTLFIYDTAKSKRRITKLSTKLSVLEKEKATTESQIVLDQNQITSLQNAMLEHKSHFDKEDQKIYQTIASIHKEYVNQLKNVFPLNISYEENLDFIPLKDFLGFEYQQITGCYIIWNSENQRYYVGQSKDIFKRLKQHFKGTVPANIIFAEDYYASKLSNKADIFKIKIIPLNTKDQLDHIERNLIDQYQANVTGYNSTRGNT